MAQQRGENLQRSYHRGAVYLLCLALFVGQFSQTLSASWWSLGIQTCAVNSNDCQSCDRTGFLDKNQSDICSNNGGTELVKAISRGTRAAIIDCKRKFDNWLWNCPTFKGNHLFGRFVENNTRETAILNAYMSAGAAHGIASACHENLIDRCRCTELTESRREDNILYLTTCGDDVNFAIRVLRSLTALELGTTLTHLVDLVSQWNNEIGYETANNRSRFCRCTGPSGSCTVQTCYEKARSVDEIGGILRRKYNTAQKVESDGEGGLQLSVGPRSDEPDSETPVFINDGKDLCVRNNSLDILGTQDRLCDNDSSGTNGCLVLCCSRGAYETTYTVQEEICEFDWCCSFECHLSEPMEQTEYRCR